MSTGAEREERRRRLETAAGRNGVADQNGMHFREAKNCSPEDGKPTPDCTAALPDDGAEQDEYGGYSEISAVFSLREKLPTSCGILTFWPKFLWELCRFSAIYGKSGRLMH